MDDTTGAKLTQIGCPLCGELVAVHTGNLAGYNHGGRAHCDIPAVAGDGSWDGFWDERGKLMVSNRKGSAIAYVDDRAIRFVNWGQALADLERHEPMRVQQDLAGAYTGR